MELQVKVRLKPFNTPNYVILDDEKYANGKEATAFALKDVDASAISLLCDEYRASVFKKAQKKDPRLK